jgi:heme-degrading monooxygenase HmoA
MTTIGMHYDVLPGKEQAFVDGFQGVLVALAVTPGHVESRLYEDVGQRGSYLIISQWVAKASFDAFITSEAFRAVTNWGKQEILRGRPRHKVYLNA